MTNKTLTVKAAPGGLVPKEFNPRDHITDAGTVDLPSTPYYRNLIREGSLVEVEAKAVSRKPKPETQA